MVIKESIKLTIFSLNILQAINTTATLSLSTFIDISKTNFFVNIGVDITEYSSVDELSHGK